MINEGEAYSGDMEVCNKAEYPVRKLELWT